MNSEFTSIIRREQTRHQLELVSKNIADELQVLITLDQLGLHKTQLESVKAILDIAARELAMHLSDIATDQLSLEEVYDACREYDQAIIWLQRLWNYLKEKFSQHHELGNTRDVSRLLKAADEVVWSCFHGVLGKALGRHGPAPLTYIEPEYSPATIQTDKPLPVHLMLEADLEFLDECLQALPIPVLRLPPACVSSPWWLIFVGHEVGHHVQYALDLLASFREGMTAAAMEQGFSEEEAAATWGNWGEEIFADVFSIMVMGQFALRAMAELEAGAPAKMVKRKSNYPSPVVRLALMKALADALGLKTDTELLGLDLEAIANSNPTSKRDYAVIPAAVTFALQPLPNQRLLSDLCDFDKNLFADGATVSGWGVMLSAKEDLVVDKREMQKLKTARDIICGSLKAWAQHPDGTNTQDAEAGYLERNAKREMIRTQTIEALLQSGPRETRAEGVAEALELEKPGKKLARLLQTASQRISRIGDEPRAV